MTANKHNAVKHVEAVHGTLLTEANGKRSKKNRKDQARAKGPVPTVIELPRTIDHVEEPDFEGELIPREYFEQLKRQNECDYTQMDSSESGSDS